MESSKRYEFDGFTFGTVERFYNLQIRVVNSGSVGTGTHVGFAFELTNAERLALVDLLSSVDLTNEGEVN